MDQDLFNTLRKIQSKPNSSQRKLADELGFSLGKLNYCLKALKQKGLVKINNFKKNKNKLSYAYILTPSGISQKTKITLNFMKIKMQEYDELKQKNQQKMKELQEQASIANQAIQYQRDKDSQVKYNKERELDTSELDLIRKMSHGSQDYTNLKRIIETAITSKQTDETLGDVQKQRDTEDMTELKKHNWEKQLELK